jgi:hypothetical protein
MAATASRNALCCARPSFHRRRGPFLSLTSDTSVVFVAPWGHRCSHGQQPRPFADVHTWRSCARRLPAGSTAQGIRARNEACPEHRRLTRKEIGPDDRSVAIRAPTACAVSRSSSCARRMGSVVGKDGPCPGVRPAFILGSIPDTMGRQKQRPSVARRLIALARDFLLSAGRGTDIGVPQAC